MLCYPHFLQQELQRAGITCLSIAHRPTLKRFHQAIVHFDGNVAKNGKGWWVEEIGENKAEHNGAEHSGVKNEGDAAATTAAGGM